MKNIILIGMPGAGKSTLGVVLAKALGFKFIDSDLLIQEQEQKRLYELINEHGKDGFLKIEDRINCGIETDHSIISTGGSIIYCQNAMAHFNEIGTIVYLKISYQSLERRLGDLSKRGVVLEKGYTLKDLYDERVPLYEKYADITVDLDGLSIETSIAKLLTQLEHLGEER